ncbi:hypothetical protein Cni_G03519 [Canna indica]|uniref:Uncharacterized protein n=1 Tax=Canna indica TaxID=4628 RepID=A0AAQ3JTL9_9LILI|nr:hypothetical protein Cni_G03519 [Canna indica]
MAADSNNSSYQQSMNSSFYHPRMVSFQSAAVDNSAGMIPGDIPSLDAGSSIASIFMSSGSGIINCATPSGSILQEPLPRFPHVSGSPAYWLPEEVETLNRGLIEFSHETSIQKYTKIAASLPRKTIRDVALRCQWMINKENGKRRKMDEYYVAKKMKDMKDKMVGSPLTANFCRLPNSTMHHTSTHDQLPSQEMKCLLDENERFLREISRNLEGGMIQENKRLFHYLRNNIIRIQNRINGMSGRMNQLPVSMRQIPPLPVSISHELLSSLTLH